MAVQNFPSSSGGGTPGMDFVKSVRLVDSGVSWSRSGSAGPYALFSSSGSQGYAYFIGATTTGVPLNKLTNITHSFTSIKIVGIPQDVISLYKVSTDANVAALTQSETGTLIQNSWEFLQKSATGLPAEYLSGSGTYALAAGRFPVGDINLIGGGGAAHQHGAGAGAGGVVYMTLVPLSGFSYSVGSGSGGSSNNAGGNTTFGTYTALGGAPSHSDYNARNGGCGSGAAKHGANQAKSGGSSIQTIQSGGKISLAYGFGGGGVDNSAEHAGGGGGGAGGAGFSGSGRVPGSGGAGHVSAIDGLIYAVGGSGSSHEAGQSAAPASGWGRPGSGGRSNAGGNDGNQSGQNGIIVVRTYL